MNILAPPTPKPTTAERNARECMAGFEIAEDGTITLADPDTGIEPEIELEVAK